MTTFIVTYDIDTTSDKSDIRRKSLFKKLEELGAKSVHAQKSVFLVSSIETAKTIYEALNVPEYITKKDKLLVARVENFKDSLKPAIFNNDL